MESEGKLGCPTLSFVSLSKISQKNTWEGTTPIDNNIINTLKFKKNFIQNLWFSFFLIYLYYHSSLSRTVWHPSCELKYNSRFCVDKLAFGSLRLGFDMHKRHCLESSYVITKNPILQRNFYLYKIWKIMKVDKHSCPCLI